MAMMWRTREMEVSIGAMGSSCGFSLPTVALTSASGYSFSTRYLIWFSTLRRMLSAGVNTTASMCIRRPSTSTFRTPPMVTRSCEVPGMLIGRRASTIFSLSKSIVFLSLLFCCFSFDRPCFAPSVPFGLRNRRPTPGDGTPGPLPSSRKPAPDTAQRRPRG